jgi:hypothetical protein
MTTAEDFGDHTPPSPGTVSIAGVPWPIYKVAALLVGILVFIVATVITATTAAAVLTGAGAGAVVWLIAGLLGSPKS